MTPLVSGELCVAAVLAFFGAVVIFFLGCLVWDAIKPEPRVHCDPEIDEDDTDIFQQWRR